MQIANDNISRYCREALMNANGDELVVRSSACPVCGERRMDWLAFNDDNGEIVHCLSCHALYLPGQRFGATTQVGWSYAE